MRVLVTGGSGRVGVAASHDLLAHGYEVVNADRRPPATPISGVHYCETDLTDVGQMVGALAGCDALIHLGAIPAPYGHANEVVFGNNVRATFAALQAASLLGVRRAVIASSLSALGPAWAPEPFPVLYAPVDEAHPLLVHDAYGLSKEVDERTAEMFHRQTGVSVVALRFHWVATVDECIARVEQLRRAPTADDWARMSWGYVDVRDAATACRLGIEAERIGFAALNITAADTLSDTPTEELLRRHTPSVEIRRPMPGTTTLFALDEAHRLIGYVPAHSWRRTT